MGFSNNKIPHMIPSLKLSCKGCSFFCRYVMNVFRLKNSKKKAKLSVFPKVSLSGILKKTMPIINKEKSVDIYFVAILKAKKADINRIDNSSNHCPQVWLMANPNACHRYIAGPLWSKTSK